MTTIAELVVRRAGDEHPGLLFEDRVWTWSQWVDACAARAAWLRASLDPSRPPHVGLLLDNVPDYSLFLGAAALIGAVIVGINPTRRGAELERDIAHTDCQVVLTGATYRALLDGLDVGPVVDVDALSYESAAVPEVDSIDPTTGYLLLFTSGTTGAPKACWCSQGRLASISSVLVEKQRLTPADVCYQAMPLFHSNALMTGWGPALAAGATVALRRKFSASGFLPDVRRYGATYFNYVGKPLSYILATPEHDDDAENPLVRVFGNEGAPQDLERFARRFGCTVDDGFGSTEGGVSVSRVPGMPPGSLGVGAPGVKILDPVTGEEKPPARFDAHGHLLNADEAIGEIASETAGGSFEGYYNNDEANRTRLRLGKYWTGDFGYRDEQGFFYFAGRGQDWLRVDGENIAAAPIERILARHPDVHLAAVYGVPDVAVGDQCMAAVQLHPGRSFDGVAFGGWVDAQADLGPVWAPRYVRVVSEMPMTQTSKILKRSLQQERWDGAGVWWREGKAGPYRPFSADDAAKVREEFARRGREGVLSGP